MYTIQNSLHWHLVIQMTNALARYIIQVQK